MILFASATFIIFSFLLFRNKRIICPSNVVFGNYFLYLVFPATLFYILDWVSWEYVLPWGKLNDWASVSDEAVLSYAYIFALFFYYLRFLEVLLERQDDGVGMFEYRSRPLAILLCACFLFLGCAYFFEVTGGLDAWSGNYSETYLSKKKGYGFLNFLLIMWSNFMAFWLGFYCRTAERRSFFLILLVFLVLGFCAYLQGLKSRVFLFGIFFSLPWLAVARLSLKKGFLLFAGFVFLFSGAMYVRSNGFYRTPEMLLEYFLTYFNTIFLHDMVLRDMPSGYFQTVSFPFSKWMTFFGVASPDHMHDISRWLTSIYYPSQWFEESATQQWPVETELYLNYGNYIFWIAPVAIYSLFMGGLYSLRFRCGPIFIFIFMSELFVFLSMFRGSMLQWIWIFNIGFYLFLFLGQRLFFSRKDSMHASG